MQRNEREAKTHFPNLLLFKRPSPIISKCFQFSGLPALSSPEQADARAQIAPSKGLVKEGPCLKLLNPARPALTRASWAQPPASCGQCRCWAMTLFLPVLLPRCGSTPKYTPQGLH